MNSVGYLGAEIYKLILIIAESRSETSQTVGSSHHHRIIYLLSSGYSIIQLYKATMFGGAYSREVRIKQNLTAASGGKSP